MLKPGRHANTSDYRYGFQGQEMDDEVKGEGNSVNYTFRMHDPRVGRFFTTDPLTHKYPWYTPYSFSGNKVIHAIELEGLEEWILNYDKPSFSIYHKFLHVVGHDDVLKTALVNSLNKSELKRNHKIYFGAFDLGKVGPLGITFDNKRLKGYIKSAILYSQNPNLYKYSEVGANMENTIKLLDVLGITSNDYKRILDDKDLKIYAIVLDTGKQSEIEQIKTIGHEIDFHLKNMVLFEITGDERYDLGPGQDHIDAYGEEFYNRRGVGNPAEIVPHKDEVNPDSKAGKLFKLLDKAYEKENKDN